MSDEKAGQPEEFCAEEAAFFRVATGFGCYRMGEGTKLGIFGHAATEDGYLFLWISGCGSSSLRNDEAQYLVRSQSDDAEHQMTHAFALPRTAIFRLLDPHHPTRLGAL